MKKYLHFVLFLTLTGFTCPKQTQADEYELKAAFIFNFTKFIDWNSYNSRDEFIIGIIDSSPIYSPLREIAKTEKVRNKKIIIRQYSKPAEINACQILFISRTCTYELKEIIAKSPLKGTLIITEKEEYAKLGAGINFVVINYKLKFEANTSVINSAGLAASSQLLKLAIIVD